MAEYDNRYSGWLGASNDTGSIIAVGSLRDGAENISDDMLIIKGNENKKWMDVMICTGTPYTNTGEKVDAGKVWTRIGVLFPNTRKEKDSQPDYTGSIQMDGTRWLSAWKGSKDGQSYMSLKFERLKEERAASEASGAGAAAGGNFGGGAGAPAGGWQEDDIPFDHRPWSLV